MKHRRRNSMKPFLTVVAGLGVASVAWGEIAITDKVKVDGFIDMSTTYRDDDEDETKTMTFDQWEIDIHMAPVDNVTARVDINDVNASDEGVVVEQAFVNYDWTNGISGRAGKFLTPLGYEGAEPTLLYQYSVSATIVGYPGYANGASAKYDFGLGSLYAAVVDGSFSGDEDADNVSPEVQLVFKPADGLTLQAGYAMEDFDSEPGDGEEVAPVDSYTKSFGNFWAEYKTGGLTAAAEFNVMSDIQGPGSDGEGYLVMVNYDWGMPALTLRHSGIDLDNDYEDTEFTISPSFQVAEPLLLVTEYRHDDYGDAGDADTFAAELIYMF